MNDGGYMCAVSDSDIADAVDEQARLVKEAYLAMHPELSDARVDIRDIRRTPGRIDVDVRVIPEMNQSDHIMLKATVDWTKLKMETADEQKERQN